MKTTLDLPDDLMRAVKIRAAQENRKLKDLIAELLRLGLAAEGDAPDETRRRIQFPLIRNLHPASPDTEMTPDRVADILLEQETRWASGR
jgi:plasmid stability protein